MNFYLLKSDDKYKNVIVKENQETDDELFYDEKTNTWKEISIMLRYFLPSSPQFDQYEELTEEQANKLIEQRLSA